MAGLERDFSREAYDPSEGADKVCGRVGRIPIASPSSRLSVLCLISHGRKSAGIVNFTRASVGRLILTRAVS